MMHVQVADPELIEHTRAVPDRVRHDARDHEREQEAHGRDELPLATHVAEETAIETAKTERSHAGDLRRSMRAETWTFDAVTRFEPERPPVEPWDRPICIRTPSRIPACWRTDRSRAIDPANADR